MVAYDVMRKIGAPGQQLESRVQIDLADITEHPRPEHPPPWPPNLSRKAKTLNSKHQDSLNPEQKGQNPKPSTPRRFEMIVGLLSEARSTRMFGSALVPQPMGAGVEGLRGYEWVPTLNPEPGLKALVPLEAPRKLPKKVVTSVCS